MTSIPAYLLSPSTSKLLLLNTSVTYGAGVVEFAPDNSTQNFEDQLNIHIRRYEEIIYSDDVRNLDIIVFPEYTLNNDNTPVVVPTPEQNIRACGNISYSLTVQKLSCAAQRVRKYIVASMIIKRNCSDDPEMVNATCPDSGHNLYNTAVAFDRDGLVVAMYV